MSIKPFENPVYITRPLLPDMSGMTAKIEEIWESKILTNVGKQHILLEEKLKEFLGVPNLTLFNNGTSALMIAGRAAGFSGEVITTPFTFPATPNSLMWLNAKPVFCDIDDESMNIDPAKIEEAITPDTTGILAVHCYGRPCDINAIKAVADKHKLKIVYDAAHTFGVEVGGEGIGNSGDLSMFSFHATKIFNTAEGGAVTFRDEALADELYLLKNFGIKNEEEVLYPGINGKMNEIQAAIGLLLLDEIPEEIARRKQAAEIYDRALAGVAGLRAKAALDGVKENYQYYWIRVDKESCGKTRDDVYDMLKGYNVFSRKYFFPLCSEYPFFKSLPSADPANLPVARKASAEILCLPLHGGLDADTVEKIAEMVADFLG